MFEGEDEFKVTEEFDETELGIGMKSEESPSTPKITVLGLEWEGVRRRSSCIVYSRMIITWVYKYFI